MKTFISSLLKRINPTMIRKDFQILRLTNILLISIFILTTSPISFADEEPISKQAENLLNISERIEETNKLIDQSQSSLKNSDGIGLEEQFEEDIENLFKKKEELELSFDEVLSGSDLSSSSASNSLSNFSWEKELKELLSPIIESLKEATSERRQISEIRKELDLNKNDLAITSKSLLNIEKIEKNKVPNILKSYLKTSKTKWGNQRKELETKIGVLEQKLSKKLSEKKSIAKSLEESFKLFFKSRGKNILISIIASIGFFLIFRIFNKIISSFISKKKSINSISKRVIDLSLRLISVLGSILVFIICLYLFEDWLLLVITILAILAIVFATKEAIPSFWHQGMLLLNMGPTREGEKIVINGISYQVKKLNFYSKLVNPKLDPDYINLPITDLLNTRSKPISTKEPWFPTSIGDWVILADGTHGKVLSQNSESVILLELGGSRKFINTSDFISSSPKSLANGFRIICKFGLDYNLQSIITEEVPAIIKTELISAFESSKYKELKTNFLVEFSDAGASSLNIEINADFNSEAGQHYKRLHRIINKICVETANTNKWSIPFDQLTIHMSEEGKTKKKSE